MEPIQEPRTPKLKVVPPNQLKPLSDQTTSLPTPSAYSPAKLEALDNSSKTTSSKHPLRKWIVGGVIVSVGLLGFWTSTYDVGGDVTLQTLEGARSQIRSPRAVVLTKISVRAGEFVKVDQPLAESFSLELDREITETQEKLVRASHDLQTARKQKINADSRVDESIAESDVTKQKKDRENDRVFSIEAGQLPARIEALNLQRQNIVADISKLELRLQEYQRIKKEGAISQNLVDDIAKALRDAESNLAVKIQDIKAAKQSQREIAQDLQAQLGSQIASTKAKQIIANAETDMKVLEKAIANLETRLKELKKAKESLTLRSPIDGIALTSDLDLKQNQELKPGDNSFLMEIADLTKLTATIEVREEDFEYVERGQTVIFRPLQDKTRQYSATVVEKTLKIQSDPSKPHNLAQVRIVVDNTDGKLIPGSRGYAKISSEQKITLYEHIGREMKRLVPLERFL